MKDPEGILSQRLLEFHAPESGVCVVIARPGMRHLGWLVTDLLAGVGKTIHRPGGSDGWPIASAYGTAWIQAEGIKDLVVGSAETICASRLTDLVSFADLNGLSLWLVLDSIETDDVASVLEAFGGDSITASAFERRWERTRQPQRAPAKSSPSFPRVPPDDFTTFLATARKTLDRNDFSRVSQAFDTGFDSASKLCERPNLTEQDFVSTLQDCSSATTAVDEAVSIARGFQAAALHAGYWVRIDVRRFLQRIGAASLVWRLTSDDWDRLARYGRPREVASAVLAGLGLPVSQLAELPADAVAIDGSIVHCDGEREVPTPARRFLIAQHFVRLAASEPQDPRFLAGTRKDPNPTVRGISLLLDRMAAATGIAFRARHATWQTGNKRGWRWRWGVSAEAVTK